MAAPSSRGRVRIEGIPELKRALDKLGPKITAATVRAIADEARQVQRHARRQVPTDTGALQRGIEVELSEGGLAADIGPQDPGLFYGVFVEEGTTSQPAQPFLRPAAEAGRRRLPGRLRREIGRALR